MPQIDNLIALGLTAEQAQEVLKQDKQIDRGISLFPLTEEQQKIQKKERTAERKKGVIYQFKRKEKPANVAKTAIISTIQQALNTVAEEVQIVNDEREITFTMDNIKYKIVLSVPRS